MVRIENVNKYFNRGKKNQIHVINNTDLSFESQGLIALLGPSGCGKTTLLNVIGGLDKIHKGAVFINGEKITGRRSGKIDEIRNLNIGYIFQNYNLVDHMTVFENVAMVLRMIGIKDQEELRERVYYALDLVGMYRYRNRYADMLSGGERQRVGIARAVAKNPAIIIADEPTGNLDSKNTIEVMNIIKAISKEKLVILVTHEEKLANFYSDRIIRLKDGVVQSDVENKEKDNLDYRMDNRIYLKDIQNKKEIEEEDTRIRIFHEQADPLNLDIVVQGGNIYISNKNEEGRLEIVDNQSSIEFVDDHYSTLSEEESNQYQLREEILTIRKRKKYASLYHYGNMLKDGFMKVKNYSVLKKLLLVGFFVSAMFVIYSLSNIMGVLDVNDGKFIKQNRDYLQWTSKKIKVED